MAQGGAGNKMDIRTEINGTEFNSCLGLVPFSDALCLCGTACIMSFLPHFSEFYSILLL